MPKKQQQNSMMQTLTAVDTKTKVGLGVGLLLCIGLLGYFGNMAMQGAATLSPTTESYVVKCIDSDNTNPINSNSLRDSSRSFGYATLVTQKFATIIGTNYKIPVSAAISLKPDRNSISINSVDEAVCLPSRKIPNTNINVQEFQYKTVNCGAVGQDMVVVGKITDPFSQSAINIARCWGLPGTDMPIIPASGFAIKDSNGNPINGVAGAVPVITPGSYVSFNWTANNLGLFKNSSGLYQGYSVTLYQSGACQNTNSISIDTVDTKLNWFAGAQNFNDYNPSNASFINSGCNLYLTICLKNTNNCLTTSQFKINSVIASCATNHLFGDLNQDGKVDDTDTAMFNTWFNAGSAKRTEIERLYSCFKADNAKLIALPAYNYVDQNYINWYCQKSTSGIKVGDLNRDGNIDAVDLQLNKNMFTIDTFSKAAIKAFYPCADINRDGVYDGNDYNKIDACANNLSICKDWEWPVRP